MSTRQANVVLSLPSLECGVKFSQPACKPEVLVRIPIGAKVI